MATEQDFSSFDQYPMDQNDDYFFDEHDALDDEYHEYDAIPSLSLRKQPYVYDENNVFLSDDESMKSEKSVHVIHFDSDCDDETEYLRDDEDFERRIQTLTLLNRTGPNGSPIRFLIGEDIPLSRSLEQISDRQTSTEDKTSTDVSSLSSSPDGEMVNTPWKCNTNESMTSNVLPLTSIIQEELHSTDHEESRPVQHEPESEQEEDIDDDLERMIHQYKKRTQATVTTTTSSSSSLLRKNVATLDHHDTNVKISHQNSKNESKMVKLCPKGPSCRKVTRGQCPKAHSLDQWDPSCKFKNKCRHGNQCPYWHGQEKLSVYLMRMYKDFKDNYFYQYHEFYDTYLRSHVEK